MFLDLKETLELSDLHSAIWAFFRERDRMAVVQQPAQQGCPDGPIPKNGLC
jgi:hypothetical protein